MNDCSDEELFSEDLKNDLFLQFEVLEQTSYYALLGLSESAAWADRPLDEAVVRRAFHQFALTYHPDRVQMLSEPEILASTKIYHRGVEAYRVLLDPLLQRRYARRFQSGMMRLVGDELEAIQSTRTPTQESFVSIVKSVAAEPFAKRADELIAHGQLKQAKLQVQLALSREPNNIRLQERAQLLHEAIQKGARSL